jgi:hypothetical protein
MHRRFFLVLSLCILLSIGLSAPGAAAQSPDWRVTVYDYDTSSFLFITAAGLQPGPALPGVQGFTQIYSVRLSPSGAYAVFTGTTSDSDPGGTYVANMMTGACCVTLQDPAQPTMSTTYIGPFSPDGNQIVVSMLDMSYFEGGSSQPPNSSVVVFDLASGSIVTSIPFSAVPSQDQWAVTAALGEWKQDGIRMAPSCWGCEGVWEGLYSIWNPATGTISAPVEPFDIFMKPLPATGEVLKAIANAAYPQSGAPMAYFAAANVVEYTADINQPTGQVIYFNPANPFVTSADWVYDGRAILVQLGGRVSSLPDNPMANEATGEAYLLFRDGRQVSVPANLGYALTGTPDGWIALQWDTGEAWVVKTDDSGSIQVTPVGTSTRWERVATNFTLGASAVPGSFRVITPPVRATCPGFVTSRLWPNTFARITPGAPNNLRAEPSTNSALLGTIPGAEIIAVLEGPTCAENMAWWKVQYLGQTGWTSEGQGSTYWIDPPEMMW